MIVSNHAISAEVFVHRHLYLMITRIVIRSLGHPLNLECRCTQVARLEDEDKYGETHTKKTMHGASLESSVRCL